MNEDPGGSKVWLRGPEATVAPDAGRILVKLEPGRAPRTASR
jgi:hypothetical protein